MPASYEPLIQIVVCDNAVSWVIAPAEFEHLCRTLGPIETSRRCRDQFERALMEGIDSYARNYGKARPKPPDQC